MELNLQAKALNKAINDNNPILYSLLSEKGKHISPPKEGIIAQAEASKGKRYNAPAGIAKEETGVHMSLDSLNKHLSLDIDDVVGSAPSGG